MRKSPQDRNLMIHSLSCDLLQHSTPNASDSLTHETGALVSFPV